MKSEHINLRVLSTKLAINLVVCGLIFSLQLPLFANSFETSIFSKVLSETRRIQIHTPKNYSVHKSYPVIFVLDGDGHFDHAVSVTNFLSDTYRIPQVIVVGIRNINRIRDFTPVHSLERLDGTLDSVRFAPTGGGGKFLKFLHEELIPFVDQKYKTQPFRILLGHSLGGLFALHAFQSPVPVFQSFVLISPAFFGGNKSVLNSLPSFFQKNVNFKSALYLSIGNEARFQAGVDTLVSFLKSAPSSVRWKYKNYEDEDHISVPYLSWYEGLRFVYADWYINTADVKYSSYNDIERHFLRLSEKFGYGIIPSEEIVNAFGFEQLYSHKNTNAAIFTFQQNVNHFPFSANVYASLADAYSIKGEKELALKNYQQALGLDKDNQSIKLKIKKLKNSY